MLARLGCAKIDTSKLFIAGAADGMDFIGGWHRSGAGGVYCVVDHAAQKGRRIAACRKTAARADFEFPVLNV
jgi:predicted methyltransferase